MSSSSKKRKHRKPEQCLACGHFHTSKHCPVLLGKREKRWDDWDKQHGHAVWKRGGKVANGMVLIEVK